MKFKIPEAYSLIIIIVIVASIATYFVPAGLYDREYNEELDITSVVEGSYHSVEATPLSLPDILNSIAKGLMSASDLIIFVLVVGGSFGVITATGTVNGLVQGFLTDYEGKEKSIIFKVMFGFALGGAIFGMAEETLPFFPVFVMMALAMKYDKITGMAMVYIGVTSGFAAGVINPFTTGVAQNIAGLPLFSGISLRLLAFFIFFITGYIYVYRHGKKVRAKGIVEEYDYFAPDLNDHNGLTRTHKLVALVIVVSIGFMAFGIFKYNFGLTEMLTIFFLMGIVSGLVGKLKINRIISEFTAGAGNIVYGAMIIGFARAILVVLESGQILDTIIYGLSGLIDSVIPSVSAVGMMLIQSIINVFISSGTGQAAVTMPVMVNIADLQSITRQTAVLAYQFGDGLINTITPTSGLLMATLAICDVKWKDWLSWVMPLLIIWMIEGCAIVAFSCIINYGPF
ncbi:YfcC family protein [Acidaminobacter sp. JC074]|uniref:YfcC family protein n=1 Tax=Acidaminobacter sp. JC074 TaxID=2530199 RepID=UPI001F0FB287|nr:AbgT family transporter [Acidaminobacter sp. JC074]MCH4886476.1 YfcC family protein [Acidaminobacter sp. JC074]